MISITKLKTPQKGQTEQFLAWVEDIPYLVTFTPHGAGLFHAFRFVRADTDFSGTLADVPRQLDTDPATVDAAGSAMAYIERRLETFAANEAP